MLPEDAVARYHAGNDPRLAEALVNNRDAASISAIFREVRAAIYNGQYQPDDRLPTRAKLAADKRVSPESIGIVMRMLAAEGLVSLEQGRGTFVLGRRRFRVRVTVGHGQLDVAALKGALAALDAAQRNEPAASALEVEGDPLSLGIAVTIETGGIRQAVALAVALVEEALKRGGGGWDLAGASVSARPE